MAQKRPGPASRLYADFQVRIEDIGNWPSRDLDLLSQSTALLAQVMGGHEEFRQRLGEVMIEKADTGAHLGLAYKGRIQFSQKGTFSAWSVIHELAHVWDAKTQWKLSRTMEKYTGGRTNRFLSGLKKWLRYQWDSGRRGPENKPGLYGRKPGVNAYGYFYGDKPSGSNWRFDRREDFAESVVMYCGWGRDNILSKTAHGRIERYLLPNRTKDPIYGIRENWADYARYFYPEDGDYTKTKRWKFVDELMQTGVN
ncbi:MAG: hypothetical protein K8S20_06565 [Chloroflexi bacterium]|nr:hypothetical protein [Chloroflexota bacterium]